jgi:hypothetical protein
MHKYLGFIYFRENSTAVLAGEITPKFLKAG